MYTEQDFSDVTKALQSFTEHNYDRFATAESWHAKAIAEAKDALGLYEEDVEHLKPLIITIADKFAAMVVDTDADEDYSLAATQREIANIAYMTSLSSQALSLDEFKDQVKSAIEKKHVLTDYEYFDQVCSENFYLEEEVA